MLHKIRDAGHALVATCQRPLPGCRDRTVCGYNSAPLADLTRANFARTRKSSFHFHSKTFGSNERTYEGHCNRGSHEHQE